MIINTDHLWMDDRRRLADMLAGLPPTDSLYQIACRLQDEISAAPTGMPDSRLSRLLDRAVAGTLDLVETIQAKRAVRHLTAEQFMGGMHGSCTDCGHRREDHNHFTRQTHCVQCSCEAFETAQA